MRFPLIDLFGVLPRLRHHTLEEVLEIMEGKRPLVPGESPWGFPLFKPTIGPSSGTASSGFRFGIPRGSSRPDVTGVVVGPPKP